MRLFYNRAAILSTGERRFKNLSKKRLRNAGSINFFSTYRYNRKKILKKRGDQKTISSFVLEKAKPTEWLREYLT